METEGTNFISRRTALKKLSFLACAVPVSIGMTAQTSYAQSKSSKAAAKYQDQPKGEQKCAGCSLFMPENKCMQVEGEISPQGWCMFWKAKAAK